MQNFELTNKSSHGLACPECGNTNLRATPLEGPDGERFVRVWCRDCDERGFFEITELPENADLEDWPAETVGTLQHEWREWHQWKNRHLHPPPRWPGPVERWLGRLLITGILGVALLLVVDRIQLFGVILEDEIVRQQHIEDYRQQLLRAPCLSPALLRTLRNVPIRYTRERAVHGNFIQYGEAGVYWGEEQIKIHRSNFWFFGTPKTGQLVDTLIHEARHRTSPALGHNARFHLLVNRDTECVLNQWE